MATRERLAWLLLAMAAAALAAAVLSPAREQRTESSQLSPPHENGAIGNQLTRIENRLDRLEFTSRAAGSGTTSSATIAAAAPGANADHSAAGTPETLESVAPPDPQTVTAMEQSRLAASTLVNRAIQSGNWTRKDTEAWMVASAGMRPEDRFALVRRLVVEVNSDRLKLDPGATFR
ncbi:MAG: hypothetical protein ABI769_02985 [Pseudomonadota bacterium]